MSSSVVSANPLRMNRSRAIRSSSARLVTGGRPSRSRSRGTFCTSRFSLVSLHLHRVHLVLPHLAGSGEGAPAMGNAWMETVAEAQRRAEKRLPRSVNLAIRAGSERGLTLADNVAAYGELGLAPHIAGLSAKRSLETVVMGQQISM